MVESETSIAFEKSKEALTKEEQVKEKMAALRAKKKPPKMTGVHPSVLELPDDNVFSYKNVKKWIKHSKDLVSQYTKTARSRATTPQDKQKASNAADHKKVYIRELEYYLKSGDYISYFSGQDETIKVNPRCVAQAFYPDGTPKRSVGVFYPDINMVWTQGLDESEFGLKRDDTNYVPKQSPTKAMTDKQFDSSI